MMLLLIVLNGSFRFKKPWPSGNSDLLQRRGYGKADRLVGTCLVCHKEPGFERVITSGGAFHGSVERLHVDGDVDHGNQKNHLVSYAGKPQKNICSPQKSKKIKKGSVF